MSTRPEDATAPSPSWNEPEPQNGPAPVSGTTTAPLVAVAADLPGVETLPAATVPGFDLLPIPTSWREVQSFCELLASSELVPKDFRGKPANVLIAVQMGLDVGLSWAAALQNIAVINGRPTMWGDSVLAVVRSCGLLEWIAERELSGEDGSVIGAVCRVKRLGAPEPIERSFYLEDAKKAGLLAKPGPWKEYPRRMLQMRARSWALRDEFGDVLKGLAVREESEDLEAARASPARVEGPTTVSRVAGLAERLYRDGVDAGDARNAAAPVASAENPPGPAPESRPGPDNGSPSVAGGPPDPDVWTRKDVAALVADIEAAKTRESVDELEDLARGGPEKVRAAIADAADARRAAIEGGT